MSFNQAIAGDVREVWDHLLEGNSINIHFQTKKEFSAFRTRLYQIKAKSEKNLIEIGFMSENEVQQLQFTRLEAVDDEGNQEYWYYNLILGLRKRETKKYNFTILPPEQSDSIE